MSTPVAEPKPGLPTAPPKPERMVSLDVFRGITIAGMILVNNPGSWAHVYGPLRHAEWHGWTPTDLIFPFFLFIVGVAITLSLEGRIGRGEDQLKIVLKILRRTIILFALGLFLNAFPDFEMSTLRIPGVLQRIAICYFFASLIFMKTGVSGQTAAAIVLLAVYWLLMKLVPVPGYGAGILEKDGNLAAYLDSLLLEGHMWGQTKTWDPEGVLSTIPAMATTLLGILTGHWLRSGRGIEEKIRGLLIAGIAGVAIGYVMNIWFPINKNLWTSSYVVFTAGMALLFLGACSWLIDGKGVKRPFLPFIIFGVNPITVYVLSGIGADLMALFRVAQPDGPSITLKRFIYENMLASWAGPLNGSLFFALAYVLFWLVPMAILYRRRIFIKI
jgi:predicted acyltransferase